MFIEISNALQQGKAKLIQELVRDALLKGSDPKHILDAMLDGMGLIGQRFKNNEIFVPEVLIVARALNFGLEILKPILTETGVKPLGKAVIGTVKGDLHDIGKNLVKMMLIGSGIEVIDLGVDVPPNRFYERAVEEHAKLICMSALLSTTMAHMKETIDHLIEKNARKDFFVLIGGAPLSARYAESIGADYYAADAATAAEIAKRLLESS